MNDLILSGCRPEPLANYLKALGVFRLLGEQADSNIRGGWKQDEFILRSNLDREKLEQFFLQDYRPTPIVAPWNGGSGFYPKVKKNGIDALCISPAQRFTDYRQTISIAQNLIESLGLSEKSSGEQKQLLLRQCRNHFPDKAVAWLDAAYILTEHEAKYPPLLGTGGNDGRLEFTNNFMQRLIDIFDIGTGAPTAFSRSWLSGALFNVPVQKLLADKPIGQFYPGAAGGANSSVGFSSKSLINPWDFILMIEGALLFAAATTKRLRAGTAIELGYPFSTRAAGVGYGTASTADETSRGELWIPLWESPSLLSEVMTLFSEGRAQAGRRPAKNSVDFAQALAMLGTDRGINEFLRYGFQERNGLAYFATPLGRWRAKARPKANLLDQVGSWIDSFRHKATGNTAPERIKRTFRAVEEAIMNFCKPGGPAQMTEIVIALGQAERALAGSPRFREEAFVKPILLSEEWIEALDNGKEKTEFQLALALASMGIRKNLEPVEVRSGKVSWLDQKNPPHVVWRDGSLINNLTAVLLRRCLDAESLDGKYRAGLGEIAAFISVDVDDSRLEKLLWGLSLIDWPKVTTAASHRIEGSFTPMLYDLLKLTCLHEPLKDTPIPLNTAILTRAASGDAAAASKLAAQRLTGSGFHPLVDLITEPSKNTQRIAAALIFPISRSDIYRLVKRILKVSEPAQR